MLRVGLTGGIGSGKSAVADLLAGHGAMIIDADLLARQAVAPGTPGLAAVVEAFGPGVLAAGGDLDREALGQIVFSDPIARARLNALVHPEVRRLAREQERLAEPDAVVVHVIPLLVETGQESDYDLVVVVDTDPATQIDRIRRRDGLSVEQATARVRAQATRRRRLSAADRVIENSGSPAELAGKVEDLWAELRTE